MDIVWINQNRLKAVLVYRFTYQYVGGQRDFRFPLASPIDTENPLRKRRGFSVYGGLMGIVSLRASRVGMADILQPSFRPRPLKSKVVYFLKCLSIPRATNVKLK